MPSLYTLLLDRKTVLSLLTMKTALRAVESVFAEYGRGRAFMPAKIYLDLPQFGGDFRAMPAYVAGLQTCGLKWVNAHTQNYQCGYPSVMAIVILNDPKTGYPLCLLDGTALTNIRTGAAGGVAAKYLARPESQIVALVGCGAQARTQLAALREIFPIRKVKIWGKEQAVRLKFLQDMQRPAETITAVNSVRECVADADIIVTTTPSRVPIVKRDWIKPGAHINAIGADAAGKRELDPQLLISAKLVVDDFRQASHSGEINVAFAKKLLTRKNIYAELGQIICGKKRGRTARSEITVFDSTGLAIQDLAVADFIYRQAKRQQRGRKVNLLGLS